MPAPAQLLRDLNTKLCELTRSFFFELQQPLSNYMSCCSTDAAIFVIIQHYELAIYAAHLNCIFSEVFTLLQLCSVTRCCNLGHICSSASSKKCKLRGYMAQDCGKKSLFGCIIVRLSVAFQEQATTEGKAPSAFLAQIVEGHYTQKRCWPTTDGDGSTASQF